MFWKSLHLDNLKMSIQYFNDEDYPVLIDWISSYILKLRNSGNFKKIQMLLKSSYEILGSSIETLLDVRYASEEYKSFRMELANLHYLLSDFSRKDHKVGEITNLDEEIFAALEKISVAQKYNDIFSSVGRGPATTGPLEST